MDAPRANRTQQRVSAFIGATGAITDDPARALPQTELVYYEPQTGRNIPKIFWDFLNASGPIYVNGQAAEGKLNQPWFVASGLPVTDAYWANVRIAGTAARRADSGFPARVLTYIPDYDGSPFNVQMGNVGQHYYDWRYNGVGCSSGAMGGDIPRYGVDALDNTGPEAMTALRAAGARSPASSSAGACSSPPSPTRPPSTGPPMTRSSPPLAAAGVSPIASIQSLPRLGLRGPCRPPQPDRPRPLRRLHGRSRRPLQRRPLQRPLLGTVQRARHDDRRRQGRGFRVASGQLRGAAASGLPAHPRARPGGAGAAGRLAYEWFSNEHPNPGPFNRDFLPGVIAAGGGAYFDYVNFHYYPQNPHFATLADKAAALRCWQGWA